LWWYSCFNGRWWGLFNKNLKKSFDWHIFCL
jgi:hypothetical protein